MTPAVQNTKEYSSSKLILHYYHDETVANSQDYMYEDDGETKAAHVKGEYELVKFNASSDKKLRISIQSDGDYPGKPSKREVEVVVHNVHK